MYSGIARLARIQPVTLEKSLVEYHELPARSLLNRCRGERMPFRWTINPYRGCEFGCRYCYARYTHEFMEFRESLDFERLIFAKTFDARSFAAELRRVQPRDWIAVGTATDPYQPAERHFLRTRRLLEVFARRTGLRVVITTKSQLIERDVDLLIEIARRNRLRVNFTITTLDARLARLLEPLAPVPALRLRALGALSRAGLDTAVFTSPVLPWINDSLQSLERVARAAATAGAAHFGAQLLFLKECSRAVWLPFIDQYFPRLAARYRYLFARGVYLRGPEEFRIRRLVEEIRAAYGYTRRTSAPKAEWGQLSLFETATPPGVQSES